MYWFSSLLPSLLLPNTLSIPTPDTQIIAPRVFIVNFFASEARAWHNLPQFDILAQNISIPGLSPLFPHIHCAHDGLICQAITGQGEINAASTISALVTSPRFDLRSTYFLLAGIAGVNPKLATVGSVTFARFAVQPGLQHEIDAREKPANFPSGYFGFGTTVPGQYPVWIDGTEVFEVNDALRHVAADLARSATLQDTQECKDLRATYAPAPIYAAGAAPPSIVLCDTLTSDTFWSGVLLAEAFENTTRVLTSRKASACSTQQEDNAVLGALLRGALANLVDFSRIIVMRSGSDFDRQPLGGSAADTLFAPMVAHDVSILNLRNAGLEVAKGIMAGWSATFERGIEPTNYIGDILGSLGGKPDFVPA
ncbi:Purine nucleoside permease [Mycena chlorophos]|uniref:Purine nucleoside permease n=1 Tax=Mycena chlorophos TaxID=658473 RepID=A0A8H6T1K7_MYCCL|nr:Purine nucleoside permease [Mycena chlorophos]